MTIDDWERYVRSGHIRNDDPNPTREQKIKKVIESIDPTPYEEVTEMDEFMKKHMPNTYDTLNRSQQK